MFNRSFVVAGPRLAAGFSVLALALTTGCAKHKETSANEQADREVSWARAALERNPQPGSRCN